MIQDTSIYRSHGVFFFVRREPPAGHSPGVGAMRQRGAIKMFGWIFFREFQAFVYGCMDYWLVVWLTSIFSFPRNIGLLIIPIDEVIFFRGVAQPPTRLYFGG